MRPFLLALLLFGSFQTSAQNDQMLIRIAELEIDSAYHKQYRDLLQEEARVSVLLEPGVIAIYPMYQADNRSQVRILEIYANQKAYEAHLKTPHFLKYKSGTANMVISLKLIDMKAIDPSTMTEIFKKQSP